MTKKILAVLLALTMIFSLCSIDMFAAEEHALNIQVFTQDTLNWGYHGLGGKWGEVKNDGKEVTLTWDFNNPEHGLTADNANADHAPVFSIQIDAPGDMFTLPEGAEVGDKGSSANYEINVKNIVISADGYKDVTIAESKNSGVLTVEKTTWGTSGTNVNIPLYDEVLKQLNIGVDEFVSKYIGSLKKITGVFTCPLLEKVEEEEPDEPATDETLFTTTISEGYTGSWMTIIPQADTAKFIEACEAKDSTVTVTVDGLESFGWAQFILQNSVASYQVEGGKTTGNVYSVPGAVVVESWETNKITEGTWYQICFQGTETASASDITVAVTAPKASEEPEPPVGSDHPKGEVVVETNIVGSNEGQVNISLPETINLGDTVTVHVTGTSDGDFRSWLAMGGETMCAEPQWFASTNGGFESGEFDLTYDLVVAPQNGESATATADTLIFKGASWDKPLSNFTITHLGIVVTPKPEEKPAAPEGYEVGPLTEENFGSSGWDSSYDSETGVITFNNDWTGRGWWIGTDTPMTGYDELLINFPGAEVPCQVIVEYVDGTSSTVPVDKGATQVIVPLDYKVGISQIYIQCKEKGELTVGTVFMKKHVDVPAGTTETQLQVDIKNTNDALKTVLLPKPVKVGEKIKFHIIGSTGADFRMWLSVGDWDRMSEITVVRYADLTDGKFDMEVEITATPESAHEEATHLQFKGIDSNTSLTNFTIDYLAIVTEAAKPETQEKVIYKMTHTGGQYMENNELPTKLEDAEGWARIATNWVDGGSVYNAIIAALQTKDAIVRITYTGNVTALSMQSEAAGKTDIGMDAFTVKEVNGKMVATIPAAKVLQEFGAQISDTSWINIILTFEGDAILEGFEIITIVQVEPEKTGRTLYNAIRLSEKYHGFLINGRMLPMPHNFNENGVCGLCGLKVEVEEEDDTPKDKIYYTMTATCGQYMENMELPCDITVKADDEAGMTRLATNWVGGNDYTALVNALKEAKDDPDAIVRLTYTGEITELGVQASANAESPAVVEFTTEEVDDKVVLTVSAADFFDVCGTALGDGSWANLYVRTGAETTLYAFEILTPATPPEE